MIIRIEDDFELYKIAYSGQCFRCGDTGDGTYLFISGKKALYIRHLSGEEYEISCDNAEWESFWAPYFDLGRSYRKVRLSLPAGDGFLQTAAREGAGIRIMRQNSWEMLISFIISQRKSIPAIRSCVEALCEKCGGIIPGTSLRAFPEPQAILSLSDEELKACGLGYRLSYIKDAACRVCDGRCDLEEMKKLSDAELEKALLEIRGVGVKVASCVGLFGFGRAAMAPVDVWIKRIIESEYGGRDPFDDYGENAGILQQYLFWYALTHKKEVADGNRKDNV